MGKKALLKSNLELWLNDIFLRNGLFTIVTSGETDIYNNDISRLLSSNDPTFVDNNTIFQSPYKNWVYEDGIVPIESGVLPPVVASGVIVNGTFYSSSTNGTYAHAIDFPNGRVVFDNALAGSPIVQVDYSYKEATVDFANIFDNEDMPIQIETALKDNPAQTGVAGYPKSDTRTLPAVFIDVLSRSTIAYELGTREGAANFDGIFHLWTRDDFMRDIIEDILVDENRQILLGINFNTAQYPLLSTGAKNTSFTSYSLMANLNNVHFWRRIYLDVIDATKDVPLFEIERSRIGFNAKVYQNF